MAKQVYLALAGKRFGNHVVSVGADTLGVDFVLPNAVVLSRPHPDVYREVI